MDGLGGKNEVLSALKHGRAPGQFTMVPELEHCPLREPHDGQTVWTKSDASGIKGLRVDRSSKHQGGEILESV